MRPGAEHRVGSFVFPGAGMERAVTESEFESLTQKIRPELLRIARRRCGRDQAEDAIQKAVMYAWLDVQRKPQTTPAQLTAWLRNGAVKQSIKELRGLGRLRTAQKNLQVLGNKGCRHTESKPNADGEETNK